MGPNWPVGISVAMKMSPSQGSSLNLALVAPTSISSASSFKVSTALPKLELTKLPVSDANLGDGRGFAGLVNNLAVAANLAFAFLRLSATGSCFGFPRIRSNNHTPNEFGAVTFVSLVRMIMPMFLSGTRPTKDPKLSASPSCQRMLQFG